MLCRGAARRILDWDLQALSANGISDICFIGGYQIDKVRADYPQFTFRHNADWENNNILRSLMHAEDLMNEPFHLQLLGHLFTADVVKALLASPADIALSVDTRLARPLRHRSNHPPDDAEKVTWPMASCDAHPSRHRCPSAAHGEYTGIAKFSAAAAARL